MLYGEGDKAFMRLQQQILTSSDDQSLLAWTGPPSRFGILAESPDHFNQYCAYLEKCQIMSRINTTPVDISNKGLRIDLICWRVDRNNPSEWQVVLECAINSESSRTYLSIFLRAVQGTEDRFERINSEHMWHIDGRYFSVPTTELYNRRTYEQAVFGKSAKVRNVCHQVILVQFHGLSSCVSHYCRLTLDTDNGVTLI